MHTWALGALLGAVLIVMGCGRGAAPAVRLVSTPAAPGSGEPALALGADGRVVLCWVEAVSESVHALRYSRWNHGAWSRPGTVAQGSDWVVNWADVPSMTAQSDGTLAAHWLVQAGGDGEAYGIAYSVSRDGVAWSAPAMLHRDRTPTEHGFVTWFPHGEGFGAVWLDGRETGSGGHGGEAPGGESMTLRFASVDVSGVLAEETVLDPRVCDCCGTDATVLADGSVVVAYRDRSAEEIRDISVVRRSEGAWTEPAPVHADGWKIAGCPVNGPALAARGDGLVVVWFTGAEDRAEVRAAFSRDGGKTFGEAVRVDGGNPLGRVDVIWRDANTALVSWLEAIEGDTAEIRVRTVSVGGSQGAPLSAATTRAARASGFPRMASAPDGTILLAWTDATGPSQVRTAVLNP